MLAKFQRLHLEIQLLQQKFEMGSLLHAQKCVIINWAFPVDKISKPSILN